MCHKSVIEFGRAYLTENDIYGKDVLEVGSYDKNGSLRSLIISLNPQSYVGVDIVEGPGVDAICSINDIVTRYGKERFDVVITTEVMEHVQDWRKAISNLKNIVKLGGIILLTTRSKGFHYHGYPYDFWRYEPEDMKAIFSDMSIEAIENDPIAPGVFIKVCKPKSFSENDLEDYLLYSIVRGRRCRGVSLVDVAFFKLKRILRRPSRILPRPLKNFIKRAIKKRFLS